jgi:hypothetical protein
MRGGHANELQSTPCVIHDGSEHRQAAGFDYEKLNPDLEAQWRDSPGYAFCFAKSAGSRT